MLVLLGNDRCVPLSKRNLRQCQGSVLCFRVGRRVGVEEVAVTGRSLLAIVRGRRPIRSPLYSFV